MTLCECAQTIYRDYITREDADMVIMALLDDPRPFAGSATQQAFTLARLNTIMARLDAALDDRCFPAK